MTEDRLLLPLKPGNITKAEYWETIAVELAYLAENDGVILTIERRSVPPLAMRNHVSVIDAWEKR